MPTAVLRPHRSIGGWQGDQGWFGDNTHFQGIPLDYAAIDNTGCALPIHVAGVPLVDRSRIPVLFGSLSTISLLEIV